MGSIGSVQEGREASDMDSAQGYQEVGDIGWAVGHREKDTGSMAVRKEVDSPGSVGRSLGQRMDCSNFEEGIDSGNLLGSGICGKWAINHLLSAENKSIIATYPLEGGPCGGAYDGVYPEWKGGGVSRFGGALNPPLGESRKQSVFNIVNDDEEKR